MSVVRRRQHLVLGAAGIDALALGLYLASAGLFLSEVIGMSAEVVGVILGLGGAASMVGAVPIARLTEKFNGPRVLSMLFVARGIAFVGLAGAHDPIVAAVAVSAGGLLNRGIGPILQSIGLEGAGAANSVRVLARIRAIRNAGIALGGVPVGFVLAAGSVTGFRLMIGAAGAIAIAAALLALSLPPARESPPENVQRPPRIHRDFVRLTVTYGLLTMSGIVLGLGLPLLIVGEPGIPRWTVGGIQVGNTVMVVALQVTFSQGSERVARARRMLTAGGVTSAAGCVLLIPLSWTTGGLAVALVALCILVFTIGELLASAGGTGMMLSFVPEGERARYLAVYNLGFAGATIVGPPLVGFAIAHEPWAWGAMASLFLIVAGAASRLKAGSFAETAE